MPKTALPLLSEKNFQAQVIQYALLKGWLVWNTWRSFHSPKGEFDLRLCRPPRYVLMELKSERGTLTREQEAAFPLLKACPGIEAYVFKPAQWSEIEKVLE